MFISVFRVFYIHCIREYDSDLTYVSVISYVLQCSAGSMRWRQTYQGKADSTTAATPLTASSLSPSTVISALDTDTDDSIRQLMS